MRVLIINYEYPPLGGGGANFSRQLAIQFAACGHDVKVMTSAHGDLPRRERTHGFEVLRIPTVRRRPDRCTVPEMLAFLGSSIVSALRLGATWRPDVTCAFFGLPCGPAALALKRRYGTPYVVALCGGDVPGFQPYQLALYHRLTAPAIRHIWESSAAVIANSQGLKELALHTTPHLPVHVIPHGAAPPAAFDGEKHAAPTVVFSGRFAEQKGLKYLVDSLALVAENVPNVQLELIGDGPERGAIVAQAQRLGVADRLNITGWLSRDEVSRRLQRASVFALPSLDEGMSNSLLEAMSAGLPVVATVVPGSDELVTPGSNGYLVPARDSDALARGIGAVLADPGAAVQMGQASQAVARRYSWSQAAQRYLELFDQAVAA